MQPQIITSLLICILQAVRAGQIYPGNSVVVQEGQGFLVKLNTEPGFGQVKYCTFLFNGEPYFLHPVNENEVNYVSTNGEIVQRFTVSECGAKVFNVSLRSAGVWQLGATSATGIDSHADFRLQVRPAESAVGRTVYGRPGESVVIDCGADKDDDNGDVNRDNINGNVVVANDYQFCEMWTGDKQIGSPRKTCKWTTSYPDLMGRTQVQCRTFAKGSMAPTTKTWTILGRYAETTSDYLNSDSSIVLRCKSKSPLKGCYITNSQLGTTYQIANGLMGDRYSSFRTNVARGLCQFEIPKPLLAGELGFWRMEVIVGTAAAGRALKGEEEEEQRIDECLFTVTDANVFQV